MKKTKINFTKILLAIFVFFIALLIINVLYLVTTGKTLLTGDNIRDYSKISASSKVTETIQAKRGTIYSSDKQVIATDSKKYNLYAVLSETRVGADGKKYYVFNKKKTAKALSKHIDLSYEKILAKLNKKSYQVEFGSAGKNLSPTVKEAIEKENLPGIEFTEVTSRNYPISDFAPYEIGYAAVADETDPYTITGKMGLEESYDNWLSGTNGKRTYLADNNNNILPNGIISETEAVDGNDVYVTIDSRLQNDLNNQLKDMVKNTDANIATVGIMEAKTGRILAISNYPTFDLNKRNMKSYNDTFMNVAVEPGSVFKPFVYSNALTDEVIKTTDTYMSGAYNYKSAGKIIATIHDYNIKGWGRITFGEGLVHSSNTAICHILMEKANIESVLSDYDDLGLFKASKIDGLYSGSGVSGYDGKTKSLEYVTTGFGQGSTVTALQLLRGYSVFANDGKTVEPYLVDKVVDSNDNTVYQGKSVYSKKIFSSSAMSQMKDLLYRVVNEEKGTGWRYKSDEIEIIGKTGTGQVAVNGKYSSTLYTHSFVGLAPYDDPTVEIVIWYQNETGGTMYSGELVKTMLKETLNLLNGNSKEVKSSKYELESYINHSVSYSQKMLQNHSISPIVIGNGDTVIGQYPEAKTSVSSSNKVMLMTDGKKITMPSMIGWSRKDVEAFSSLSGIPITIKGEGNVYKQSSKGQVITSKSKITVYAR